MIVGRKKEKEILDSILKSPQAEFVTIYGRRRVGKTFLIREYCQKNIVFDFTGSLDTNTNIQLYNFYTEFKRATKENEEIKIPENWSEAFNLLTDYLYSLEKLNKKIVVFIDELPWLDRPKSGFLSALQYFWNQHGSKMKYLALITCGSAASWIIQNLVKAKNLLRDGFRNEHIRKVTGWFLEKDGKWRSEISDKNLKVLKSAKELGDILKETNQKAVKFILYDILDAPELFSAYPHLKSVNVIAYPLKDKANSAAYSNSIFLWQNSGVSSMQSKVISIFIEKEMISATLSLISSCRYFKYCFLYSLKSSSFL